jgi:lipopolysaccharide export system protein LptA
MTFLNTPGLGRCCLLAGTVLLLQTGALLALESDRQQPLEVDADATDGTLGDGKAVLKGNVEIRQGTLLVKADVAEVEKVEGRVRRVILTGKPVQLQQEIEEQGLVTAKAMRIEYEVASGIITLSGAADVIHPQYQVRGETLIYDMKLQHFQGNGGDGNGRIQIQLDPELVPDAATGIDSASGDAQDNSEEPPAEPDERVRTDDPLTDDSAQ